MVHRRGVVFPQTRQSAGTVVLFLYRRFSGSFTPQEPRKDRCDPPDRPYPPDLDIREDASGYSGTILAMKIGIGTRGLV